MNERGKRTLEESMGCRDADCENRDRPNLRRHRENVHGAGSSA